MNYVRIIRSGLCSTVQDTGRARFRHLGVALGGAMDLMMHKLANQLVGNTAALATIEMTLTGDEVEFGADTLIAITGADMTPVICCRDAGSQPVPQHCPVAIPAGSRLCFQAARRGCRSYMAIAGGVDVPVVMESRSTALSAAFGGHRGRKLAAGDELPIGVPSDSGDRILAQLSSSGVSTQPRWFVRPFALPNPNVAVLRIVAGTHTSCLDPSELSRFFDSAFRVSSQSDRMGYRLTDHQISLEQREELLSEGTVPGTIQLPPDGNPILLMSDCAPTGGYPRIGHVISADLGGAAQLRPGQSVGFVMITLEQAQVAFRQQRQDLVKALAMAELLIQQQKVQHAPD